VKDGASVPVYGIPDVRLEADLEIMSCVKDKPYIRSFWGTPIHTAYGSRIGVLWMLDDKVRSEIRIDHLRFIGQVFVWPVSSLPSNVNFSTITSLVMRNLESRKESIERRKILRVAQAIDYFINGDQGNHDARNWDSSTVASSLANDHTDPSHFFNQGEDDNHPRPPSGVSLTPSCTAEQAQDAQMTRDENIVVSKPGFFADDETIDSKDKRDRDLVYARASYLIRESLSMQGW
jgi:hypothetical protein